MARGSRTVRAAVPLSKWDAWAAPEFVISQCRYAMADGLEPTNARLHAEGPGEKGQGARQRERRPVLPRKLLDRGVAHCAKKLGEEAIETTLAAVSEGSRAADRGKRRSHLPPSVVLHARGIALADVEAELFPSHRRSGLDEKAARKGGG